MARTTEAAVRLVIATSLESDAVLAFIADAGLLADRMEALCEDASAAQLEAAERYIAAGLISLRDPTLVKKTMDDVSETYQRKADANQWFEQAKQFDPCGVLDGILNGKTELRFRVGAGYA